MSEFDLDIRVTTPADTSDSVHDGFVDATIPTCVTCTCKTCYTCATDLCGTCYYTCLHVGTNCMVPW